MGETEQELRLECDKLRAMVASLQASQIARNRIFANINHEIRTPVTLIMLAVGNLKTQTHDLDKQDIVHIETSVRRLLHLVDSLLLLAAGQEGKLALKFASVDLAIMLRQIIALWLPAAHGADLKLQYEGLARCPAVMDDNAFERIISNLLSNAIKFTPKGGQICVSLSEDAESIYITVRDTGIGLHPEFKQRIFGRYEQDKNVERNNIHGSGIGLSLVKELVEAHQGHITADNNPQGGALFSMIFPKQPQQDKPTTWPNLVQSDFGILLEQKIMPPEVSHQEPTMIEAQGPAEATILVVDDNYELCVAMARLLQKKYRIILAIDGMMALKLAKQYLPDLLIADIQMPGMDGIELSRKFRDLPGNRLAPILLVTAHSGLAPRLEGFEAGAVDYVLKPFEPAELLARVQSQLALRSVALKLSNSEKLASLGLMSAGLAHEIRNPANAVVNAIEPFYEALPKELLAGNQALSELLNVIRQGALQLRTLSQQLLGFVRPGELTAQPEDLEKIIDRSLAMSYPILKGIEIRKEFHYTGSVTCAASLFVQVLTNMLENAAHALEAIPVKPWIQISSRQIAESLILEVADNGPGIPVHLRERIFEPFFSTKPPGKGSGLGLSTARTIIERHHGLLSIVDSKEGAIFRIEIPARSLATDKRASA